MQGLSKQPQVKLSSSNHGAAPNGHHSQSPQANQPNSRDFSHQRKILHKSLNSSGVHQPGKVTGASMDGPKEMMNSRQQNLGTTKSNGGVDSRSHHATLNMSSHMISAR